MNGCWLPGDLVCASAALASPRPGLVPAMDIRRNEAARTYTILSLTYIDTRETMLLVTYQNFWHVTLVLLLTSCGLKWVEQHYVKRARPGASDA